MTLSGYADVVRQVVLIRTAERLGSRCRDQPKRPAVAGMLANWPRS